MLEVGTCLEFPKLTRMLIYFVSKSAHFCCISWKCGKELGKKKSAHFCFHWWLWAWDSSNVQFLGTRHGQKTRGNFSTKRRSCGRRGSKGEVMVGRMASRTRLFENMTLVLLDLVSCLFSNVIMKWNESLLKLKDKMTCKQLKDKTVRWPANIFQHYHF